MRAALIENFQSHILIEDVAEPEVSRDAVLIQIEACGICRSDHHAWSGQDPDVKLPHVMGHEFAGVVLEVGKDVKRFRKGDRVTAPFILGCGHCPDCEAGQATICENQDVIGFTMWGAFAERIAVPHADFNLVHLPDRIGFAEAAGMGCRVTTAYRAINERGNLQAGEWLAVHGCGGVGLSAILLAKAMGTHVVALDPSPEARDLAKAMGADVVLAPETEWREALFDITNGGAHLSIDAVGLAPVFKNSVMSLRKLGRHVQVGMPLGEHEVVELKLLEWIYSRQIEIKGSRGIAPHGFSDLMALIERENVDISRIIRKHVALSDIEAELNAMSHFQNVGVSVITDFDR